MRLSQIDESNRADHHHLGAEDLCLYLYEYTSGRDFAFSATNNLISNLKKKPSQYVAPGFHHKARAINQCTAALRETLNPNWLAAATLVPIPSSKAPDHPDHDDRIERICKGISAQLDVRNLIIQTESTIASHEAQPGERIALDELRGLYQIDETLAEPPPNAIGIIDDVLTAGTHYRAMKEILAERFPGIPIVGIFVARRVFATEAERF
jgi:hypothetical protein